ncbi:MAG: Ig-like domain-containing protein, partial [Cyanobacteria bacterium J06650_10]
MDNFELLFDNQTPTDENELGSITGSIVGLDSPGGEVTLEVDFGDISLPSTTATFSLRDDGTGADKVAGDGNIEFAIQNQYLDDDPSGTTSDTYQIEASAREQVLAGTDAVFVVDVSGSSNGTSGIDIDGDGFTETVLEAEVAAFKALNQDLIDRGLGDTSKVSISVYSSSGQLLDLDPGTDGVQTFTTPNADKDGNGIRDVDQALDDLRALSSTNFEAGLEEAIKAVDNAGTPSGGGSVIFLSDGDNNSGGTPADEAARLRNEFGQNVRAFGVGASSALPALQEIDPNAKRFEDIQDLLDLFSGVGSNVNQFTASTTIEVLNVAPEADIEQPSPIEAGNQLTLSGSFSDPGTLDTFTLDIDWGDASTAAFDLPAVDALRVGRNFNSTADSGRLIITSIDMTTGEVGFSIEHLYADAGTANIEVAVSDDDSAIATETTTVSINPITGGTNGAPNAVTDMATTDENTDIRIAVNTVLANDSDPDSDPLTISALDNSQTKGIISFDGTSFSYSPNGQFDNLNSGESAADRFTYTVSDGAKTDTATVTITVNGVGTPGGGNQNAAPEATDDTATTNENRTINITGNSLLANDSDPDGDALTITGINSNQAKGEVSFDSTNISYNPNGQFDNLDSGESATDRFTYTVSDGAKTDTATVLLTINGVGTVTPPGGNPGLHLRGTRHPDVLIGGAGNDKIFGIGADDLINGKGGDDRLAGGHSNDTILGGSGNDKLYGYNGKDLLKGGSGSDKLYGGKKNDQLEGQGGNDNLLGGTGNDLLLGGGGKDRLIAGNGRDRLDGGAGNDKLTGGNGRDTFVLSRGAGSDIITDFHKGVDVIELTGQLEFGALSFKGNRIIDDSTSKVLATLVGVDATQ